MKKRAIILTVTAKRALCLILMLALLATLLVIPTWNRTVANDDVTVNDLVFTIDIDSKTATLTSYIGNDAVVIIPGTFDNGEIGRAHV